MHLLQRRILELASKENLAALTLRDIGNKIGEKYPQNVKHHIGQLLKKGFLKENLEKTKITRVDIDQPSNLFYSIPILGSANCGQALTFADENFEGYLQISKSLVPNFDKNHLFAIKAVGESMNNADINGEALDDRDYAIIDNSKHDLNFYNNKYVLSIIDGMANIKRLKKDNKNQRIVLISESTQDYPPIVIDNADFQNYLINGEVIKVIKRV